MSRTTTPVRFCLVYAAHSKRSIQREGQQEEADRHDFWPTTYVLPGEYALFAEESKRRANSKWIMKPIARSQGRYVKGTLENGWSRQESYLQTTIRWRVRQIRRYSAILWQVVHLAGGGSLILSWTP